MRLTLLLIIIAWLHGREVSSFSSSLFPGISAQALSCWRPRSSAPAARSLGRCGSRKTQRQAMDSWRGELSSSAGATPSSTLTFLKPDSGQEVTAVGEQPRRPLLLYLPGAEQGEVLAARFQFQDLSRIYDLRQLRISASDRSSFAEMVSAVSEYLRKHSGGAEEDAKALLLGEGFGGMLSLGVALHCQEELQGLVLVNPATSFDRSPVGQMLSSLPLQSISAAFDQINNSSLLPKSLLSVGGRKLPDVIVQALAGPIVAVGALDRVQRGQVGQRIIDGIGAGTGVLGLEALVKEADNLMGGLGADTVRHRLAVMAEGLKFVNPSLSRLSLPTLVLAGEEDGLLPSQEEAQRLCEEMTMCKSLTLQGAGHLPLDGRVNVTRIILESLVAPRGRRYNPIKDFVPPSKQQVAEASQGLSAFKRLVSPVLYSSDLATGEAVQGMGGFESIEAGGRPILLVGNHQLWGLDTPLFVSEVYHSTGILLRGMAHPSSFALQDSLMFGPSKDGERKPLETFGAVNVGNPRNFYSLLESGQTVLLYPGGMSEAFDPKVDEYNLLWPDKTDFVRAAAKFDAIIVPFAGVGGSDIGSIYEYKLGNSSGSPQAPASLLQAVFGAEEAIKSFGTPGLNDERLSLSKMPPLVIPNPPWETPRFYYRFGAPIDTRDLKPSNKEECQTTYNQVRGAVEDCISYLLDKRKQDPYAEQRKRFMYETLNARQAPSFDP